MATVSVTQTCRDIDELSTVAQTAIRLLFQECVKAGVNIFVTETYRSQARQDYLYAQGRTREGNIVTWTKSSRHKLRMAWDIGACTLNGNDNIYNTSIIKKAGAIAVKLGITWGGSWVNNLDYPHFEVKESWNIPKGYALDGKVSIPTRSNIAPTIVKTLSQLPKVELVIPDETLEEAVKLKELPLLKDSSSPTLRTAAINMLKAALASGAIKDEKWIKAAEDGTLSMVDLQLLTILIGPGTKVRDISSAALKAGLREDIKEKVDKGVITNDKFLKTFDDGSLPIIDLLGLLHYEK